MPKKINWTFHALRKKANNLRKKGSHSEASELDILATLQDIGIVDITWIKGKPYFKLNKN